MLSDRPPVDDAFGRIYFHCDLPQFQDQQARGILLTTLYQHPVTLFRLENAIRLITHGIAVSAGRHDLTAALLSLLSNVLAKAREHLGEKDLRRLKAFIIQSDAIQGLCLSQDLAADVHEGGCCVHRWLTLFTTCFAGIRGFVSASFDPTDAEDRTLLSYVGSRWAETMTESFSSGRFDKVRGSLLVSVPEVNLILSLQAQVCADLGQVHEHRRVTRRGRSDPSQLGTTKYDGA